MSSIFKLQYTSDGVHRQLSSLAQVKLDLAHGDHTVSYSAPHGTVHCDIPFDLFTHPAVNPPVRRLVIISKQLPWPVEVSVEHSRAPRFVRVADVLLQLQLAASTAMRQTEYLLARMTEGGARRMAIGYDLRGLGVDPRDHALDEDEPFRRVDFLGQHSILGGLRKDVNNAVRNELIPQPRARETEETLFLVADFASCG
ncbi:hypothetical protein AURDEDRAFT_166458 [Auricularia subglabra TFB-10046 SS5]|nr:hypothetical protein AURDEDRAFT_166458 [Auricularia subglabra TFB-10046 SS5]